MLHNKIISCDRSYKEEWIKKRIFYITCIINKNWFLFNTFYLLFVITKLNHAAMMIFHVLLLMWGYNIWTNDILGIIVFALDPFLIPIPTLFNLQHGNLLLVFEWKDVTWLIGRQPYILNRRCDNKNRQLVITARDD